LRVVAARRPACGAALFMLAISTQAYTEVVPPTGEIDSRVRVVAYNNQEVYRLHGFVGYQIDLQFEPGESFVGMGAGDLDALSFVAAANHLFIKPKVTQVGTNLTVLTTKRSYQFDYTASVRRGDVAVADVIYSLRFTYVQPAAEGSSAARVDGLLGRSQSAKGPNTDYWYCGSSSLKPVTASDDGVHTRLRFASHAEQPAIFVRNDDGSESLLNFSMQSGDMIVHRVVRELVVRRGRLTGRIVNKSFVGSGERLESGTVSPAVERVNVPPGQRP
jgi:type IV secretion system protein VirB9